MKVGILGSGDVGRALGSGFVSRGHDVMVGSRTPKAKGHLAWLSRVKGGASAGTLTVGTLQDAARHGEVVVLAVPGEAVDKVLRTAGVPHFARKLVIDVTNAFAFRGSKPGLLLGIDDSVGEQVQRSLPKAKVVKAFNTIPSSQMVDPKFRDGVPAPMIAGNDAAAKQQVVAILRELGWPGALDLGKIEASRWLEALTVLWWLAGESLGRWDHAFAVVHG